MNRQHSLTPWRCKRVRGGRWGVFGPPHPIDGGDYAPIAVCSDEENAVRIVAAVNGEAELRTGALQRDLATWQERYFEAKKPIRFDPVSNTPAYKVSCGDEAVYLHMHFFKGLCVYVTKRELLLALLENAEQVYGSYAHRCPGRDLAEADRVKYRAMLEQEAQS